jgi:YD repeat-containing protein
LQSAPSLSTYYCTSKLDRIYRYCGIIPKDINSCQRTIGNPIDSGTGNKSLIERDYEGVGSFPLSFVRYYNSSPAAAANGSLGMLWRSNFDRRIVPIDATTVALYRHDGRILFYRLSAGNWRPDADMLDVLTRRLDAVGGLLGWQVLQAADDSTETYDAAGQLVQIKARSGVTQTLSYSTAATDIAVAPAPNLLIRVADSFGRQLNFTWNASRSLNSMTSPAGDVYQFAYDAAKRLVSITYPETASPKPVRSYLYGEPNFTSGAALPNALTGVLDEKEERYASYAYDATGRGISTEHAGGSDRFQLTYSTGKTSVVDALNTARDGNFQASCRPSVAFTPLF